MTTRPGGLRLARSIVATVSVALLAAMLGVITTTGADAAGTVLFQNSFTGNTVNGTGTVTVPLPANGANAACLTAFGNGATLPLLSCSGAADVPGFGKLRLTNSTTSQVGGVFGQTSFPTSNGLDVTFNAYQWGGGGADGLAFLLGAVDPANPVSPIRIGPSGGSLGYSPAGSVSGLPNAYLGVGLDVFGNFSAPGFQGTGCVSAPNITAAVPGAVVVRGPGNGLVGYCGLTTTWNGNASSKVTLRATTRAASVVPVQVLINPTTAPFTSDSGVTVAAGGYTVVVKPVGQPTRTLTGTLPTVTAGLYPSSNWLNAAGVPKQLAFGFVGSTGSVTDAHEISDVKVLTFNPVPQLGVSTTSYAAATSQPGDPVTYKVASNVLVGADETSPISVTQTVPTGAVPAGAYGSGWVCQPPAGQSVTCTTSASAFANGTALPVLTVVAIVTAAGVTSATVQNASPSRASSVDASPGTDTVTTLGTLPTVPSGVTVAPAIGSVSGGNLVVVSGANITAATAIEIGTTTEQQAGTPVTLFPCPGAAAPGCFTVSGGTLRISSMPARPAAATTTVTVVTSGVADAADYVYADRPATPATPTAVPGITSATVTWVAPASNGSPITGYVVTPVLGGVAQTPQEFDASAISRTLSGLTAGAPYTFTVAATNAYGTSAASAPSAAVVPYTLPGAPTVTAVTAGSLSATLTWTAPGNGGSAITGYVVTPYIGLVAQTPQTFTGTATTRSVTGLTAGTAYTFTVSAQNLAGTGPASAKSTAVTPNQSPSLTFPAPPAGEVGVAYSRLLTVTNGTSPFTWSISSGTLPAGMTLSPTTGLLGGTPTAAGTFAVTVKVTDASGLSGTKAVTLVIAAAPSLVFSPSAGEVGVAYSQQPTLSGGTAPFVWSVTAGSLPAGLVLSSSSGLVSGTPTAAGSFPVTLTVTDAFGQTAARTVTFVIVSLPAFAPGVPPTGQVGVAYTAPFDVTGGTLPLSWSVSAGSLPAGLTLDPLSGAVSGTPTSVGTSSFTVTVRDANEQSATKAATVVISTGPLLIVKTANVSSAPAGSVVAYTVSVTNTGSSTFTGVALTDPLNGVLDDATYNADATATSGVLSYTAPTLGWTGNLGASAVVTITYTVTVNNPDVGNKVLANTVSSPTLGTNCAAASSDSRCNATVSVPGLTIVKTAAPSTTRPGGTVVVTIVVTNTGQTPYPAATLTDSLAGMLDDAQYNADGNATTGSISYASPSLVWTGTLGIGASATITYSVTVHDPDVGNRSLTGTVVSASPGSPCPSGNPAAQCSVTVPVLVPALVITNAASPATTTPGGTVTHTATLSNTGQTAYTGAEVSFSLAAAVDDATYSADAVATAGSVVYTSGTSTLTWTGNLAIGAVVTITWSTTVRSPDPGDKILTTVATSTAQGSTCPPGSPSPACTSSVHVLVPELTIATSANVATTTPGSLVRYTVAITDTGQTPYSGAVVSQALGGLLDDADYDGDVATTVGNVSVGGSTLSWTGNLAVGATATVTYSVTVHAPDLGDRALTTTATSGTAGNTCPVGGADPRCVTNVPVLIPGVAVSVVADTLTTTPGVTVGYTFTAHNTGQTSYAGLDITLDLVAALDDADYDYDAQVTAGTLVAHPDGTTSWVVSLAAGATESGTLSMTVRTPPVGDRSQVVTVVSDAPGSSCSTAAPAPSCRSVVTVLVPGLTITKTANTSTTTPGEAVGYTISVVNTGQSSFPAATLSDDLALVLTDATYAGGASATSGSVSYAGSVLSWTGALAPGASATITYSVTVRDPDPGDKLLVNTVVSPSAGSNCAPSSTDVRCRARVAVLVPDLTIATSASVATTVPGATVGHTIAVTNSGATAYTAATFSSALAGILDDAAYNADATATRGTVTVSGSVLTWTGDLAIGATATITYTTKVHTADGGDNLLTSTVTSTTRGSNCTAGSPDAHCAATVPVARLVIAQGYAETSTTPGSVLHLTATFTNTGQVPYTGITVSSPSAGTVDDAIPTGDQTATSGTLTLSATAISWTGSIPVGGVVTIQGTLTVKNPDTGDKLVTGTLVSSAPGNTCPTGGSDPRCTALATVFVPELTITKVANTTTVLPGGTVGYTVTVHNTGLAPYTAASVSDSLVGILDKAAYSNDAVATSGTVTFASPTITWTGDLAASATAVITYSVVVPALPTGDKTLVNTVSSTTVGNTCPPASGNPACRSTVVILTPVLSIVKTADVANATLGSTVTYTIKATNAGQTSYPAAAFSDPLADVLDDATYGSATTTSGTLSNVGGVLGWSGALLAPGSSVTVTYSVTIKNPATGDRTMRNTVSSANPGSNCPAGAGDSRCTATVSITNSVSLTFTKKADVTSTVLGAVVHYTVTVTNSSVVPVVGASYTDPLADLVDDATYNNDAVASSGAVTYAAPNIGWSGTSLALSTVTVTYSVTVHASVTGNLRLVGTVSSASFVSSNNCVAGSTDPRCTSAVNVAILRIEQHYTETSTTPGSIVRLNATFTNTGQQAYTGITIASPAADTVDDAIPNGDQVASSGTLVLSASGITWTGNIPVGGTVTVTGTLTVENPDPGNRVLTGTLTSVAPGNNCLPSGTDPACTATLPVLLPGLTISKTAGATFVVPGGSVGYTITVRNSGQTAYLGASVTDTLVGILDDATYSGNATSTSGTVTFAGPSLTWTGDLAVGAVATITYSVVAHNPATGDKTMVNPVSSTTVGSTCLPASSNPACTSTIAVLTPALTIVSSASAVTSVPGQVVTYTVTATNTGQVPFAAATFDAPLTGIVDDAVFAGGASATSGTVGLTAQTLTWTGALGTGAAATVTYTVTVDQPVTGDFRLGQTITSATPGNTCPTTGSDPRCTTSVPIASLLISNETDVATTKPTSTVGVIVTVTNVGQVPYVDAVVNDDLVGSADDSDYNGDASATSGSLVIVVGTGKVVWTGDIPVGGTVTVTASLTVKNPDPGDKLMTTRITTDVPATNCPTAAPAPAPACLTSVTVLTPALTVTKSASVGTAVPGSSVGYTITVTNTGETAYTDATVGDSLVGVLADATYNGDATATAGAVSFDSPSLTWVGDLAVDEAVVITYSVRVNDPDLGGRVMANAVTSDDLGSTCPTEGSAPACTTLVTVLVPALDVAVTADRTTTVPGGAVAYTVTIHNTGQTAYVGTSVSTLLSGVLDDATYAGGATATSGVVVYASPTLTWTGSLALDATVTVSYVVAVRDPAPGDHLLTTSVSSPAQGSSCGSAAQCSNTVTVLIPGLAVRTTADGPTTTPGHEVVVTTTLTNTGQTPYDDIQLTTALGDVLDDAPFDGTVTATIGVATYTAPVITWRGTLRQGDVATITYAVTVTDPDPGNKVLTAAVVAAVPGSSCSTGSEAGCSTSVVVLVPTLLITKSASAPTTTPGGRVTYTIVVANTGETAYAGAVVDDSLSGVLTDSTYNGDALATGGALAYAPPTLTWTGDLQVGASVSITYSVTVRDPDPGDKQLVNTVTSAEPGSTCRPESPVAACTSLVRVLVPALVVTKTADTAMVTAGGVVHYTVSVVNTGETSYAPAVVTDSLAAVLDDAVYAGDAASDVGTVAEDGGTLVWTGPLAVGGSATITYSVTTTFPADGDHTMTNIALSTSPGTNCVTGSDPRCRSVVGVRVPALTVVKTASDTEVVAGGSLRYTITATNAGESDYPVATLTDAMAGVHDDATYAGDATATSGTIGYAAGTLTWSGALARGATVLITYSVDVPVTGTGNGILDNRVVSDSVGSDCVVTSANTRCVTSTPIAARTLTLTGLTPSFTLTGLPDSTITSDGTVVMTVTTNSTTGYSVSVQSRGASLVGITPGNSATIPIVQLGVRESGAADFQPMSSTVARVVHSQNTPSGPGGDAISNDYRIQIPFVPSDTYTTTLDYVASSQ